MCGPLVLTYAVKGEETGPWYRKITPNVAYQLAKMVSYMIVGLLLGTIGSFIKLDTLRPWVMLAAGVFMIVLGLGMTGKVPWAARLTPRPPKWLMNALLKMRRKASADAAAHETSIATPITFGLMTGLLPCGPLMAAQVAAAASGSAISGATGMAAFALGTAPLMVAFGTAGSLIPMAWKNRMMTVLAIGVMIFGLVFINRGLMLTGSPVTFGSLKSAVVGTSTTQDSAAYKTGADGVVEVPITISGTKFIPSAVQIPADKPVRLVVDRQEAVPCSDQIALPQLGILKDLAPNAVTTVEIPATKAGTYTLTCGMGMMSGQLVVAGAGARSGSPLLWLALAALAAAGAMWASRRREQRDAGASKKRTAAPAAGMFGFTPLEFGLIVTAVVLAVVAGLYLGGMFA
jgi:sulfite exporter TauE/SafE